MNSKLDQFEVSEDGSFVDGPRQEVGEPIDLSSIPTQEYISYLFAVSVVSCYEGVIHCGTQHFRLDKRSVRIRIKNESDFTEYFEFDVNSIFDRTLGKLGFSSVLHTEEAAFDLEVVIKPLEQASEYMEEIGDQYGVDYFNYLIEKGYS